MCELVAKTINPSVGQTLVPALPIVPIQHDPSHREKEQETPHVSALAGLVELAAVVEADEEARQLVENVVDLNALISEISDLPKDPASPEVTAMVTKLLSRAEMLSSPEALAAVRAEADGLRSVPTWDPGCAFDRNLFDRRLYRHMAVKRRSGRENAYDHKKGGPVNFMTTTPAHVNFDMFVFDTLRVNLCMEAVKFTVVCM